MWDIENNELVLLNSLLLLLPWVIGELNTLQKEMFNHNFQSPSQLTRNSEQYLGTTK